MTGIVAEIDINMINDCNKDSSTCQKLSCETQLVLFLWAAWGRKRVIRSAKRLLKIHLKLLLLYKFHYIIFGRQRSLLIPGKQNWSQESRFTLLLDWSLIKCRSSKLCSGFLLPSSIVCSISDLFDSIKANCRLCGFLTSTPQFTSYRFLIIRKQICVNNF